MAEFAPIVPVILIVALIIAEPISLHFQKNEKFTLTVNFAIFALSFSFGGGKGRRGTPKKSGRRRLPLRIIPSVTRAAYYLFGKSRIKVNALTYTASPKDYARGATLRAKILWLFSSASVLTDLHAGELTLAEGVPAFSIDDTYDESVLNFDITADLLLIYIPASLLIFFFDIIKRGALHRADRRKNVGK